MIRIFGDLNYCDGCFDVGIGTYTKIKQEKDPFCFIEKKKDDFWIGNFEGVCSNVTNTEGIQASEFRVNPDDLRFFKHMDVYSVANNHVMQHGADAYIDTLKNIESFGSIHVGSRKQKTIQFSHQGKRVSITAFSQRPDNFCKETLYWERPEYVEIMKEFEENAASADYKIAYIHWGNEFMDRPYNDQKCFAHWLVDIGFDLIVGLHPHVLQGYELYKGKYIFYSLGNSLFYMAWYKTQYGAILTVDFNEHVPKVSYDYIFLQDRFAPKLIPEDEVPSDCQFPYLNMQLSKELENEKYYYELFGNMSKYRKHNHLLILKNIPKFKFPVLIDIVKDFIKRRLIS